MEMCPVSSVEMVPCVSGDKSEFRQCGLLESCFRRLQLSQGLGICAQGVTEYGDSLERT